MAGTFRGRFVGGPFDGEIRNLPDMGDSWRVAEPPDFNEWHHLPSDVPVNISCITHVYRRTMWLRDGSYILVWEKLL